MDLQTLLTYSGFVVVTKFWIGMTKEYVPIHTRLYATLFATALYVVANVVGNGLSLLDPQLWLMGLVNGPIIAMGAGFLADLDIQPPSPQQPDLPYDHD